MRDDQSWDGPSLHEETRTVQEHALELLLGVVVLSILLGLSINLAASLIFQVYNRHVVLIILLICAVLGLLAIGLFAFRILTTVKEFHQEVEIALPLLVSKQDLEVLHVKYYDNVTEPLRAALARCPAQERQHIAQILQSVHDTNAAAANPEIVQFGVELIQLLVALLVVRNLVRLLGPQASFRKSREVMQLQSSTVTGQWRDLASQVPDNHYLQDSLHAVPQKIILPNGIKLHLSNITQQISGKVRSKYSSTSESKEVTLLKAIAGPDTVLAVTAITPFSVYGLPRPNMPRRGLTARCILRNARDRRLHELLGELLPLFHSALLHIIMAKSDASQSPFIQIGKQLFMLEEVVADDDASGWTGFTSFTELVEQAQTLRFAKVESLALEFASLTTFNRANQRNRIYGGHYARLPLPHYVFPGLARRWQELAPPALVALVQMERIERYIDNEGIVISDYDLNPHQVRFTTHTQPGFIGKCCYDLRAPDEPLTDEAPLTVRQQFWLLAQLAFYCGVGTKTAMGLGQARFISWPNRC